MKKVIIFLLIFYTGSNINNFGQPTGHALNYPIEIEYECTGDVTFTGGKAAFYLDDLVYQEVYEVYIDTGIIFDVVHYESLYFDIEETEDPFIQIWTWEHPGRDYDTVYLEYFSRWSDFELDASQWCKFWILDEEEKGVMLNNNISIVTSMNISGPLLYCSNPVSYELEDQATGSTLTWVIKQGLTIRASGSGVTASASNITNGEGDVTFTANFTCGLDALTFKKDFWLGCPEIGDLVFTNDLGEEDFLCSDREGNLVEFSSSTCYNYFDIWLLNEYGTQVLDKSKTYTTQASLDFSWISPGYYLVQVRGINDCGTGQWNGCEVEYVDCWELEEEENMYYLKFVPNPAYNSVEISVFEDENLTTLKTNNEFYQIQIYNSMKVLKYQVITKEPILRINTANFENGVYFVYFVVGKETQVLQLVISH